MQRDQLLVGPMSVAELREAIERPAQAVGLELEPGLTEVRSEISAPAKAIKLRRRLAPTKRAAFR